MIINEEDFKKNSKEYTSLTKQIKKLTEKKKLLEEDIKEYMDENNHDKIEFNDCSITFNKFEKTTVPNGSVVMETCHKVLSDVMNDENFDATLADDIIDKVRDELENKQVTKVVKSLRVNHKK